MGRRKVRVMYCWKRAHSESSVLVTAERTALSGGEGGMKRSEGVEERTR